MRTKLLVPTLVVLLLAAACRDKTPPPPPEANPAENPASQQAVPASGLGSAAPGTPKAATPSAVTRPSPPKAPVSPDDPLAGVFPLSVAVEGLAGKGRLLADIQTSEGKLICELFEERAPNTVANFVGLARGLRPFKDPKTKTWVKRKGYDGTTFHRIIKGFMIQGGDPEGTGKGEPGYVIPDEIWPGATHEHRGLICMANRGPNTNGMQFFILDAPAKHLDRSYTIFGACGPEEVIDKLASSPVEGDRAKNPPKIRSIKLRRAK